MLACAPRSTARSSEPPRRLRRRPIPNRSRLAGTCMPMPERNLVQAVRDALYEEMERDDRVCILGEDVGRKGGVFKATEGLQQRFGEQRVLDTPLAESSIAAVAQGLALEGFLPVAEMQFADYSFPAFNQIVNEIAKVRYRSNGDFGCPLVIRAPTGGGVRGALYHSQSPEAFYCHVPGLKVVLPSTPADLGRRLRLSLLSGASPASMPRSAGLPARMSRPCRLVRVSNTRSCSIPTRLPMACAELPATEARIPA